MSSKETKRTDFAENALKNRLISRLPPVAILTGVYIAVNFIYQWAYLGFYGLNKGIFPLDSMSFLFSNYIIVVYAVLLWGVLIWLPDSLGNHFESLLDISLWFPRRGNAIYFYRYAGIFISVIVILFDYFFLGRLILPDNYYRMRWWFVPVSHLTGSLFFVLYSFSFLGIYRAVRSKKLKKVSANDRRYIKEYLNMHIIVTLSTLFYALIYMVPKQTGELFASIDWQNMMRNNSQAVSEFVLREEICDIDLKLAPAAIAGSIPSGSQTYYWKSSGKKSKIFYVGKFQGEYNIFGIVKSINDEPYICLIPNGQIISMNREHVLKGYWPP